MASTNVRQRGKIRHEEWPQIAERFRRGETLAEIARSYRCTAPAIRYIVGRTSGETAARPAHVNNLKSYRMEPGSRTSSGGSSSVERSKANVPEKLATANDAGNGIWGRINNDIATFLACMDELFAEDSDGNYDALLKATDRLLWASARTRLELERVINVRRAAAPNRRISG